MIPKGELKMRLDDVTIKLVENAAKKAKCVAEQTYELAAEIRDEFITLRIEELIVKKRMAISTNDWVMAGKFLDEQRELEDKQRNGTANE